MTALSQVTIARKAYVSMINLQAPAPKLDEEEVILQQEEIDAYNKMKQELQLWTLAASVVGFLTVWMLNSKVRDALASFHLISLLLHHLPQLEGG